MQITTNHVSSTEAELTISLDTRELAPVKQHVLGDLGQNLKLPGFRGGKVPASLVEKNVDPNVLQSEVLEHAINNSFPEAIQQSGLRPAAQPQISVNKFEPFTTLEYTAKLSVIGPVKLADYKKLKLPRPVAKVTKADIDEVIESLRQRAAEKSVVKRVAKEGDEVIIDFKGVDDNGKTVNGAEGQDYPLTLGSNAFIPGFEDQLIGLKARDEKTFSLKFPKDYRVKALANRKVTFSVTIKQVNQVQLPKLDDKFASSVGPVKTVEELRADIKKELTVEKQRQADLDYESELVKAVSDKSQVEIPVALIDEEVERMMQDLQQNLIYRGQTVQEFLQSENTTEADYKQTVLRPQAAERVKAGLVLAEIAEAEKLTVTPEELAVRIQSLKSQYQDQEMRQELDKPENRRNIASRMLSEKTVAKLAGYAQATS